MTPIKALPDLDWSSRAEMDMALETQEVLDRTEEMYQLGSAGCVGIIYTCFTSPPFLWMLLSKNVSFRDLLDFTRLKHKIPAGTTTLIRANDAVARRFAEFYDFKPVSSSDNYIVYKRN